VKLLLKNAELVTKGIGYTVGIPELLGEHEHLGVLLSTTEALLIPSSESLGIKSTR
jgi:hypothetical protein